MHKQISRLGLLAGWALTAVGCASILGIEEQTYDGAGGGSGGGGAGGAATSTGSGGAGGTSTSSTGSGGAGGVSGSGGTGGTGGIGGASTTTGSGGAGGTSTISSTSSSTSGSCTSGPMAVSNTPCCTPDELACAGHAQKLVLICDSATDRWKPLQSCSGQQLCDTRAGAQAGTCQDPVPPCIGKQPGDYVCSNNVTVAECGPDLLTSTETACPFMCVEGACTGVCVPGSKQCSGLVPQTCDANGAWASGAACSYMCSNGACSGSCVPGSKRCSGLVPQTCDANGAWASGAACSNVCSSGVCSGSCVPGSKQCSGLVPQTCDANGAWTSDAACPYVCSSGACSGSCVPGSKQCVGNTPQTCSAAGAWTSGAACSGSTPVCVDGACADGDFPPSCAGGATGQADCGPGSNESCCLSLLVPGGTVQLDASHTATVSDFRLDKYQITVGRFRTFVDAWVSGWRPSSGAGKHTHLNGGSGLSDGSGGYEPGWDTAWSSNLKPTKGEWDTVLSCSASYQTWTSSAGAMEKRPINCASWFETAAFCIWDGGFLPSEAEWQYAAAGGSENRQYPWGATAPTDTLAVFCGGSCSSTQDVGSKPAGNGKWGHSDLAGNVWEWALVWSKSPYALGASTNYANVSAASYRVVRGGSFGINASNLLASNRGSYFPSSHGNLVGARCARSAP